MMACQRPMSYAVNKDPPPSSFIGTSISTPLSGTKWKKNLARLSRKWNPGSRHTSPLSGTAAAAATEKLIRRPKTTIQTEDLTASQFASMAGIKIKRGRNHQDTDTSSQSMGLGEYEETDDDDDDTEDDDDDHDYSDDDLDSDTNTHGMLPLSLNHRQLRQLTTKVTKAHSGSVPGMTSYSSLSSSTTATANATAARCHPIWDARFWQHQSQQQHQQHQKQQQQSTTKHQQPKQKQQKDLSGDSKQQQHQQIRPLAQENSFPPGCSSLDSTGRSSDLSAKDTLSSGSSSLDTCLSVGLPSAKPRVLHKGRFQIVLGDDDTAKQPSEPLMRTISSDSNNNVVEWHRKRAMTQ